MFILYLRSYVLYCTELFKSTFLSLWSAHVCNALVSVLSPKSSPLYLRWETDHDLQNRNNAHCTGTRIINSFCVFILEPRCVKIVWKKAFGVLHQKGESSAIKKGVQVDPDCLYCSNGEGWVQKTWRALSVGELTENCWLEEKIAIELVFWGLFTNYFWWLALSGPAHRENLRISA
jgi:hypothetical protein